MRWVQRVAFVTLVPPAMVLVTIWVQAFIIQYVYGGV